MLAASAADSPRIRVMLVDDSAVVRGIISIGLRRNPNIEVIASASDGDMAISVLKRNSVDVILLDVEMPNKDGLTALPELKQLAPNAHIIMVSSLTQRNAKISLKALDLGASDYLAKPSSTGESAALEEFYQALEMKVMALGEAARATRLKTPLHTKAPTINVAPTNAPLAPRAPSPSGLVGKRSVLAIASSTGGPQALHKLLRLLKDNLAHVPVLITQHMPATFTELLASHIRTETGLNCHEGKQGEPVLAGHVYIAPGGFHMSVEKAASGGLCIKLEDSAPVNFCKPAADPMFDSIAHHYGRNTFTVVLTGMGNDGCKGAKRIKDAGGYVMVQDKETSVVWGMPGAIANEGFHDDIGTIERIAESVQQALR